MIGLIFNQNYYDLSVNSTVAIYLNHFSVLPTLLVFELIENKLLYPVKN